MDKIKHVTIFTDGACQGNPGPGGWAALLRYDDAKKIHEKSIYGREKLTTNNRMELTAMIEALKILKKKCRVKIVTDSKYAMEGFTTWMPAWEKRNWTKCSDKKVAVKNVDLWKELKRFSEIHHIKMEWVKGHSGYEENEIVDQLAREAVGSGK